MSSRTYTYVCLWLQAASAIWSRWNFFFKFWWHRCLYLGICEGRVGQNFNKNLGNFMICQENWKKNNISSPCILASYISLKKDKRRQPGMNKTRWENTQKSQPVILSPRREAGNQSCTSRLHRGRVQPKRNTFPPTWASTLCYRWTPGSRCNGRWCRPLQSYEGQVWNSGDKHSEQSLSVTK